MPKCLGVFVKGNKRFRLNSVPWLVALFSAFVVLGFSLGLAAQGDKQSTSKPTAEAPRASRTAIP